MKYVHLAAWLVVVFYPGLPQSSPQFGDFGDVDPDLVQSIFGSDMNAARYGAPGEEWEEIPITLLPEDDGCNIMEQPRGHPPIQRHFEELKKIEVVKAEPNKNCDYYTQTRGFECVPYYQCDENEEIITDGAGLIDIRFGGGSAASPEFAAVLDQTSLMCKGSLEVCCKNKEFEPETPPPPPPSPPSPPCPQQQYKEKISEESSSDYSAGGPCDDPLPPPSPPSPPSPPPPPPYKPQCGQRNEGGLGVKVQNYQLGESQFGEWPHICAILQIVEESSGGYGAPTEVKLFVGGSSLIASGAVLTAAHKVLNYTVDPSRLLVRCGEWDTQTDSEPLKHQDRKVKEVIIHPRYNRRNLGHTAAILILESEFTLDKHIDTICLPDLDEDFLDQKECFVKGWGKDKWQHGEYQQVLKTVDVPMVDRDYCQQRLRTTKVGRRFRLDPSFVCAGGVEGKDACKGDGGGPLVCPIKGTRLYAQVGIVAWGIGCGDPIPAVYMSVTHIGCWIDYTLKCHLQDGHKWRYNDKQCGSWIESVQPKFLKCPDLKWPGSEEPRTPSYG